MSAFYAFCCEWSYSFFFFVFGMQNMAEQTSLAQAQILLLDVTSVFSISLRWLSEQRSSVPLVLSQCS
jgi:hypothetical protein